MEEDLESLARSFDSYGFSSKIDCYSALGLIGLLGLLEILRDIVNQITIMRKKRDVTSPFETFFTNTAVSSLKEQIPFDVLTQFPGIVLPLLHVVADVNDNILPVSCLEFSFCESNRMLVHPHQLSTSFPNGNHSNIYHPQDEGFLGLKKSSRWKVAQFLSEVIAKAFLSEFSKSADDESLKDSLRESLDPFTRAMAAAELGRKGQICEKSFISCDSNSNHLYRMQPDLLRNMYS